MKFSRFHIIMFYIMQEKKSLTTSLIVINIAEMKSKVELFPALTKISFTKMLTDIKAMYWLNLEHFLTTSYFSTYCTIVFSIYRGSKTIQLQ